MADTRKDKRTPVSLKVRFKSATVDEFIEQYSRDLSRGGIFIKSKQPMPVGTLLKFEMQLKDESPLIHGVGRVVWKREAGEGSNTEAPSGMGIKFIRMEPECRALVERIVAKRGDGPGQYEAGGGDGDEVKNGESSFFPKEGPSEEDLPAPEDRTQVRHANEFLASALAEAGSTEVATEAEKKAEETRRRAEERARAGAKPETHRAVEPKRPAPAFDEEETLGVDEQTTVARPRPRAVDEALAEVAAEREAKPAIPSEPAPPRAAPSVAPAPLPAPPSAAPPRPATPGKKHGKKKRPSTPPPAHLVGVDTSATPPMQEQQRSSMVPALIAVASLAGLGVLSASMFGQREATHEDVVAHEEPQIQAEAEPEPEPEPVDAGPPAPPPVMASVSVQTTPEGAQILVGNQAKGLAPLSLELPVDTATTVIARMQGYLNATQEVTLTEGEEHAPLELELEEMPYFVVVTTTPPGARLRVTSRGLPPRTGITDESGTVRIELAHRPVASVDITATLRGHSQASISVEPGSFAVQEEQMIAPVSLALTETAARTPTASPTPRPRPAATADSDSSEAPIRTTRSTSGSSASGASVSSSGSSSTSSNQSDRPTPTPSPAPTEAPPDNPF